MPKSSWPKKWDLTNKTLVFELRKGWTTLQVYSLSLLFESASSYSRCSPLIGPAGFGGSPTLLGKQVQRAGLKPTPIALLIQQKPWPWPNLQMAQASRSYYSHHKSKVPLRGHFKLSQTLSVLTPLWRVLYRSIHWQNFILPVTERKRNLNVMMPVSFIIWLDFPFTAIINRLTGFSDNNNNVLNLPTNPKNMNIWFSSFDCIVGWGSRGVGEKE